MRTDIDHRGGQQGNPSAPRPPQAKVIPAAPPRPAGAGSGHDGTWGIDAHLYARILAAHTMAEESYFRALTRDDGSEKSASRIATLNARAEGLAEAIAIISGDLVVDVRVRSTELSEKRRQQGLQGVDRARRNLDVHLRSGSRSGD